ncbi:cholecystokinin receptor type A-like [Ostrea edulis]|uniref:cholecystokinin receptor type A-like n=1 Tax=Ostrea edulis TaxID=37623 RepID=UPI0024AF34A7|nr:cholecystokinin receptor type A-like [Ostrea edulis]
MGNILMLEHNIEGRKERAPLGAASYLFNLIGIIGNILVLHVFGTRINASSNYRVFVIFLSIVDLFTCISHVAKELDRTISVYNQGHVILICKVSHYIGNSVGYAAFLIICFITFERYKKICTPFTSQITITHSKIMCLCSVLTGFIVDFPIYLIYGKRYELVENINATRCAIQNEYDGDLLPILHLSFLVLGTVIGIVIVVILQVKIRMALVKKARSKQKMKQVISTINSESEQETPASGTPHRKGKHITNESKKSTDDQDSERNRRIAIRFAIISLFLIVSFVSHLLFRFITVTQKYFVQRQGISKLEDIVEEYLPDIITVNGILNPFIYLFTDIQFKQELMKMCGRTI